MYHGNEEWGERRFAKSIYTQGKDETSTRMEVRLVRRTCWSPRKGRDLHEDGSLSCRKNMLISSVGCTWVSTGGVGRWIDATSNFHPLPIALQNAHPIRLRIVWNASRFSAFSWLISLKRSTNATKHCNSKAGAEMNLMTPQSEQQMGRSYVNPCAQCTASPMTVPGGE